MTDNQSKNRGLGRGLSALMSDVQSFNGPESEEQVKESGLSVKIDKIHPNPDQPRRSFNPEALDELAGSIKEKGIIQPLIVRPSPRIEGNYEIVAGERRWRASQIAELHEVPVIVREFSDLEVLEVAIIENIQRSDLSVIDEAAGYKQLVDKFGYTQDQLSKSLGKSRSHIANILRLLNLPAEVRELVTEGALSAGHARTLIGRDNAVTIARLIVDKDLSVREAEKLAQKQESSNKKTKRVQTKQQKDPDTIQLENELSETLKMKVTIDHDSGKEVGKVVIEYNSLDKLDDLLRIFAKF